VIFLIIVAIIIYKIRKLSTELLNYLLRTGYEVYPQGMHKNHQEYPMVMHSAKATFYFAKKPLFMLFIVMFLDDMKLRQGLFNLSATL